MKQIMSQFGGVLLAGIAMVLLFVILMNVEVDGKKGIFEITGAMAVVEGEDYSQNQDQETLSANKARKRPVLSFEPSSGKIKSGTFCSILEELYVTLPDDEEKYSLSEAEEEEFLAFTYKIKKILSPVGDDVTNLYDPVAGTLVFPSAGDYTFELYIKDSQQKESRLYIKVPVDS